MIKGGPQFGGDERDLEDYVKELNIQDGKELTEFFHRAKVVEYEIGLENDQTGQLQRLTKTFLQ